MAFKGNIKWRYLSKTVRNKSTLQSEDLYNPISKILNFNNLLALILFKYNDLLKKSTYNFSFPLLFKKNLLFC